MKAPVREIFASVQGEGPYVGYRQVFVRFPRCNIECAFCDTPRDWGAGDKCIVYPEPGTDKPTTFDNPMLPEQVLELARFFGRAHSISLTGGEPLLYSKFIKELRHSTIPLYLETNMTLPDSAKDVKDVVRYVSGDFKMKGQCDFKGHHEKYFEDTVRSFSILRTTSFRDCFCKIILTNDVEKEELTHALGQIKDYVSMVTLQPVTPTGGVEMPSLKKAFMLMDAAMDIVGDVRMIPQTHKFWGCQ